MKGGSGGEDTERALISNAAAAPSFSFAPQSNNNNTSELLRMIGIKEFALIDNHVLNFSPYANIRRQQFPRLHPSSDPHASHHRHNGDSISSPWHSPLALHFSFFYAKKKIKV